MPPEEDVKQHLGQEGIFPLSAAGHLPGIVHQYKYISMGTGTANTRQQMRQLHTGHQSHHTDLTAKLRGEFFTAFQKQFSVSQVSLSHSTLWKAFPA